MMPVLIDSAQNLNTSKTIIPDGMIVKETYSTQFKVGDGTKTWSQLSYFQGVKGDIGPQGLQGIQGPKGDTGAKGATGPTGPTGPAGAKGAAGTNATTTAVATQSANGLMSAVDKKKLDGIAAGAQVNPTLPTVKSLFPSANNKPGHFAVFDNSYVNAGYLTTAQAKTLLAPDLSEYAKLSGSTFTGNVVLTGGVGLYLNAAYANTDFASGPTHNGIIFRSANNSNICILRSYLNTINSSTVAAVGLQFVFYWNGKTHHAGFELWGDGTPIGYVAAPPAASNGAYMATTNWVRSRIAAATGKGATTFSLTSIIDNNFCEWSPDIVTSDMLEAAKKVINEYCTQAIFFGFWYELNGETYFFTYDLYDQQNFSDNAILALNGENASLVARNESDKMVKLRFSAEEMLALYKYALKEHKQKYIDLSLEMKNGIIDVHSKIELEGKMMEYGLFSEYTEYMKAINMAYISEENRS